MDKNRIEGRPLGSRWHNTPKTSGILVEVNAAVARWSNSFLPGEISRAGAREKSAEVIVVEEPDRVPNGTARGSETPETRPR